MPAAQPSTISLPTRWTNHVRSGLLQVIGLAQYATVYTRSWAASSRNARVRLKAENDRLHQEVALLRERADSTVIWLTPDAENGSDAAAVTNRSIPARRRPWESFTYQLVTVTKRRRGCAIGNEPVANNHDVAGNLIVKYFVGSL